MSEDIKIGELVIMNDCDAPCPRLIAIVEDIKDGSYLCRYFSTYPNMKKPYGPNPTRVSDFGVDVIVSGNHFCAHQTRKTIATYDDGKPRYWQPQGGSIQRARKKPLDIYWKHYKRNSTNSKGEA